MDDEIKELINSLVALYGTGEIDKLIKFAIYFRSDDPKLYEEFKLTVNPDGITSIEDLIKLYAKRYNLDPEKDMQQIRNMYVNNVFNKGYVFHLTSRANVSSIDESGLNPIYSEEQDDIKRVREELTPQGEANFFLFAKDDYHKLYYSRILNLKVNYGFEPEWIRELNKQFRIFDTFAKDETEKAKKDLRELRVKYSEKYKDRSRVLYLIPSPTVEKIIYTSDGLDSLGLKPEEIIRRLEGKNNNERNKFITSYIPRTSLVCIDLSNGKILERNQEEMTM